jgi:hypothetical protein
VHTRLGSFLPPALLHSFPISSASPIVFLNYFSYNFHAHYKITAKCNERNKMRSKYILSSLSPLIPLSESYKCQ